MIRQATFKNTKPCKSITYRVLYWWGLKDSSGGMPSAEPTTLPTSSGCSKPIRPVLRDETSFRLSGTG